VKCLGIRFRVLSALVRTSFATVGKRENSIDLVANNTSHLCMFDVNTQYDLRCTSVSLIISFAPYPFEIIFEAI